MVSKVEYIWLDGAKPTRKLRSKTKIVTNLSGNPTISDFPEWSYDGSSTEQSDGSNSDLTLKPVNHVPDPIRGQGHYLVLCEVFAEDGTPHDSNARAKLRTVLNTGGSSAEPWIGFEQEYTLLQAERPLGWPETGYPRPQGPYYCGVGPEQVYGRELVENHLKACIDAGLYIYGINAEVMPSQWEYQLGFRGNHSETPDPLTVSDHAWIARWLLLRLGEDYGVEPSFDNKPVRGDWNGAGQHTNFSTAAMRDPDSGMHAIEKAIGLLSQKHKEHIAVYGDKLEERLTGLHETCSIEDFKSGVANRGASIRIPRKVSDDGYGYLEDRRPGANADPYEISARLIKTICEIE